MICFHKEPDMNKIIPVFSRQMGALAALILVLSVGLACNMRSDAEWKQMLGGKKLSKASNSGAISDKVDIYFCPSGEYGMETQFTGFSTGGAGTLSMADSDVEYGQWSVSSGTLVLVSQNGERREYSISQGMDTEVVELNGNGYLVTRHNECGR
jgi:hypothetical protein